MYREKVFLSSLVKTFASEIYISVNRINYFNNNTAVAPSAYFVLIIFYFRYCRYFPEHNRCKINFVYSLFYTLPNLLFLAVQYF